MTGGLADSCRYIDSRLPFTAATHRVANDARARQQASRPGRSKHHRPVAVQKHPALQVEADRTRQRLALAVTATFHQVTGGGGVIHALDLLLDDRTFVKVGRDKVGSRADQFDPSFISLTIRPSPEWHLLKQQAIEYVKT